MSALLDAQTHVEVLESNQEKSSDIKQVYVGDRKKKSLVPVTGGRLAPKHGIAAIGSLPN